MNKAVERLSRNLAGGMSRRRALWKFAVGAGALGFLTTRKASAAPGNEFACVEFAADVYNCCLDTGVASTAGCLSYAEELYVDCLANPNGLIEFEGHGKYCIVTVEDNEVTYVAGVGKLP